MKRGEIYFIKSTHHEVGSEQRGDRPAVIVSNNLNNEHSETVEVVYLTTRPKADLPTHVFTRNALSTSTILCEQIFTVSKKRVDGWIGELSDSEMLSVDASLAISLGLDFGKPQQIKEIEVMREPTEEEWEAMRSSMKRDLLQEVPAPAMDTQQTAEILHEAIKMKAERDVYKDLYLNLLEHMKGATNQ